jgi:hypothetical protein
LRIDNWDDFSFKTSFWLVYIDNNGKEHDIGSVKIGFIDKLKESDH